MACNTQLTTITKGCSNNTGGLAAIYIIPSEFVSATTVSASGEITGITLSGVAKFVSYEFNKNSASYVEDAKINLENGSTYHQVDTTLTIPRRELAKRQSLSLLLAGQRNVKLILKDNNGLYWFQGYSNSANLTALGEGSGKAKGDGSKYSLTIMSEEPDQMYEVDDAIIAALIS